MIYIITKDGKRWEMNQSQLFSFIDKQSSDGYDYINNMETAEQKKLFWNILKNMVSNKLKMWIYGKKEREQVVFICM